MIEYFIVHRIRNKILTIHLAFKRKFQKCFETMENGNKGFLINKNKIFYKLILNIIPIIQHTAHASLT